MAEKNFIFTNFELIFQQSFINIFISFLRSWSQISWSSTMIADLRKKTEEFLNRLFWFNIRVIDIT